MPHQSHGWGLVGLCGSALMGSFWLTSHPVAHAFLVMLAAVGFVVGLVLLLRPALMRLVQAVSPIGIHGYMPVREAAISAFEGCEGTPIGAYLGRAHDDPESRLGHIFHFFETYDVPIFAASPPSRTPRPISPMKGDVMLLPGGSDLAFVGTRGRVAYRDASVRRSDLRRLIRELRRIDPGELR